MTEVKDLNVRLILSRALNADPDGPRWRLLIEDSDSGIRVGEVRLTDGEFSDLQASTSVNVGRPAQFVVSHEHGWRIETMDLLVEGLNPETWDDVEEMALAALSLSPHPNIAKGGWAPMLSVLDSFNHHRRAGTAYRMSYRRYVSFPKETGRQA